MKKQCSVYCVEGTQGDCILESLRLKISQNFQHIWNKMWGKKYLNFKAVTVCDQAYTPVRLQSNTAVHCTQCRERKRTSADFGVQQGMTGNTINQDILIYFRSGTRCTQYWFTLVSMHYGNAQVIPSLQPL